MGSLSLKEYEPGPDEQYVIERLLSSEKGVFYLTGPAGSGKSTLVHHLRSKIFENVICAAPTGVAALNIKGQTLHSLFRLPFGPLIPDDERLFNIHFRRPVVDMFRKCNLLVIDEISMVRADVLDAVDLLLRHMLHTDEPFGGKLVLLVGDIYQLEPVVRPADFQVLAQYYASPFFFDAHVLSGSRTMETLRLTEIYRQKDKRFLGMLNSVKRGEGDEYLLEALNERVNEGALPETAIVLCSRRADAENMNMQALENLHGYEKEYFGSMKGVFPEDLLPCEMKTRLKEGARVMFVKNDVERRYVNGSLGTVHSMEDDEIRVLLDEGNIITVMQETWDNTRYDLDETKGQVVERSIGSYSQFPLKLAWAITIHKSQGLTFDEVQVDMGGGSFASGLLYVALSRCRTLEGITLKKPLTYKDFRVHPMVIEFGG